MILSNEKSAEISRRFTNAGLDLHEVIAKSTEVIIFGSFASDLNTADSDLDVLCIGYPKRIKSQKIDLVRVPISFTKSPRWLTSELANHVATYGVWLKGDGEWKKNVSITVDTIAAKHEQILVRAARVGVNFQADRKMESDSYDLYEVTKLRRDLQRSLRLCRGISTPPSAILDREWRDQDREALLLALNFQLERAKELLTTAVTSLKQLK